MCVCFQMARKRKAGSQASLSSSSACGEVESCDGAGVQTMDELYSKTQICTAASLSSKGPRKDLPATAVQECEPTGALEASSSSTQSTVAKKRKTSPTTASRSSPSPTSGGERFHLADPTRPPVNEDPPASFKLAHMSFASPTAVVQGEASLPTASSAAASAATGEVPSRPLSRHAGSLSSAGHSQPHQQQPVLALPFSNFSPPPAPSSTPSCAPSSAALSFVEEELSSEPILTRPP